MSTLMINFYNGNGSCENDHDYLQYFYVSVAMGLVDKMAIISMLSSYLAPRM